MQMLALRLEIAFQIGGLLSLHATVAAYNCTREAHQRDLASLDGCVRQSPLQGLVFQMPRAYSPIVRSLENLPELATFNIALRSPCLLVGVFAHESLIGFQISRQVRQVQVVVAFGQQRVDDRLEGIRARSS